MRKRLPIFFIMLLLVTGCSMNLIYSNEEQIASDNNSYNLEVINQTINEQNFTGHVIFEGMDTIWKYDAKEDCEVTIDYLLNVMNGKIKLVLISPDETINSVVEVSDKSSLKQSASSPLKLKKGENRIKLVGANKADLSFEIAIEVGQFFRLGM